MGTVDVKVKNAERVEATLNYIAKDGQSVTADALMTGAEIVASAAKAKCPVLTGNLSRSITVEKESEKTVLVGTDVEYAPYVEYGTYKMGAQPYLLPALSENKARIEQAITQALSRLAR